MKINGLNNLLPSSGSGFVRASSVVLKVALRALFLLYKAMPVLVVIASACVLKKFHSMHKASKARADEAGRVAAEARAALDVANGARDAAVAERDAARGERDAVVAERDAVVVERDAMGAARDASCGELEVVRAQLAALQRRNQLLEDAVRVANLASDVAERQAESAVVERDAAKAQAARAIEAVREANSDRSSRETDRMTREMFRGMSGFGFSSYSSDSD